MNIYIKFKTKGKTFFRNFVLKFFLQFYNIIKERRFFSSLTYVRNDNI